MAAGDSPSGVGAALCHRTPKKDGAVQSPIVRLSSAPRVLSSASLRLLPSLSLRLHAGPQTNMGRGWNPALHRDMISDPQSRFRCRRCAPPPHSKIVRRRSSCHLPTTISSASSPLLRLSGCFQVSACDFKRGPQTNMGRGWNHALHRDMISDPQSRFRCRCRRCALPPHSKRNGSILERRSRGRTVTLRSFKVLFSCGRWRRRRGGGLRRRCAGSPRPPIHRAGS